MKPLALAFALVTLTLSVADALVIRVTHKCTVGDSARASCAF